VSATAAGTTLIPLTLSLVFGSLVSSQIVQRTGRYKLIIVAGMAIIVVALWWLTRALREADPDAIVALRSRRR
jgi:hypothetical protein